MSICNLDHFAESYWRDKRFALVGGGFDPLHEGHLAYFREARKWGELVCAVTPDAELRQKRTPLLPEMTRLKLLNATYGIEHVHLAVFGIPAVIRALQPTHYVVGKDWEGKLPEDTLEACSETGTVIVFVNCRETSSTALLADYERRRNTEKLAAFERFVSQQTPAVKPWAPVTDYSFEARCAIEAPQADIIRDLFRGCTVFDYGCGFGYLMGLLQQRGMTVYGWDPAHTPEIPAVYPRCDLVICREVLEHLTVRDIRRTVQRLITRSKKYVYLTTRFTSDSNLLGFDHADALDPTHISLLNQDYLRSLFVLEGCTRRADLESKLDHRKLGRCLVYEVPA